MFFSHMEVTFVPQQEWDIVLEVYAGVLICTEQPNEDDNGDRNVGCNVKTCFCVARDGESAYSTFLQSL